MCISTLPHCVFSENLCQSFLLWIISSAQWVKVIFLLVLTFRYLCSWFSVLGRGLKVDDILKDDEVLTAFLLRDAGLSESIVYQLVNAQIRLEQVHLFRKIFAEVNDEFLQRIKIKTMLYLDCGNCTCLKRHYIHYSNLLNMNTNILMLFCSLHLESQTCSWKT